MFYYYLPDVPNDSVELLPDDPRTKRFFKCTTASRVVKKFADKDIYLLTARKKKFIDDYYKL